MRLDEVFKDIHFISGLQFHHPDSFGVSGDDQSLITLPNLIFTVLVKHLTALHVTHILYLDRRKI